MTNITPGDIDIGARTIFDEARGEPYEGKKAVGHVLINRRDKKIGDRDHSIAAVALRWRQFSGWNEGDPNRTRGELVTVNDRTFRQCICAMMEALDEPDNTGGATHYHTRWIKPDWAEGKTPCKVIGNHYFYNDID